MARKRNNRRSFRDRSFSEKVMIIMSILIALSMILALFGSFAPL